jgi:hypothetical protein
VVVVLDAFGNPVATAKNGEVVRGNSEHLPWARSNLPRTRYRLGGDLWVAKASWLSRRRFSAELSQAMLARDDTNLLVGIASILTQDAVARRRALLGAAGGFSASWG